MKMEGERKKRSSRDNREVYYHKRGKKKKKKKNGLPQLNAPRKRGENGEGRVHIFFLFFFKTKREKKKPYNLKEKKNGKKGKTTHNTGSIESL